MWIDRTLAPLVSVDGEGGGDKNGNRGAASLYDMVWRSSLLMRRLADAAAVLWVDRGVVREEIAWNEEARSGLGVGRLSTSRPHVLAGLHL